VLPLTTGTVLIVSLLLLLLLVDGAVRPLLLLREADGRPLPRPRLLDDPRGDERTPTDDDDIADDRRLPFIVGGVVWPTLLLSLLSCNDDGACVDVTEAPPFYSSNTKSTNLNNHSIGKRM
jgi:hypothetical protein